MNEHVSIRDSMLLLPQRLPVVQATETDARQIRDLCGLRLGEMRRGHGSPGVHMLRVPPHSREEGSSCCEEREELFLLETLQRPESKWCILT